MEPVLSRGGHVRARDLLQTGLLRLELRTIGGGVVAAMETHVEAGVH